jgi:hypothetical protein
MSCTLPGCISALFRRTHASTFPLHPLLCGGGAGVKLAAPLLEDLQLLPEEGFRVHYGACCAQLLQRLQSHMYSTHACSLSQCDACHETARVPPVHRAPHAGTSHGRGSATWKLWCCTIHGVGTTHHQKPTDCFLGMQVQVTVTVTAWLCAEPSLRCGPACPAACPAAPPLPRLAPPSTSGRTPPQKQSETPPSGNAPARHLGAARAARHTDMLTA